MNGRDLVIRTDATESIGAGHVLRSLAIAQRWRDNGGTVCFVAADLPVSLRSRLANEGMQIHMLSSESGSTDDAHELLRCVRTRNTFAIVLDGYQFGSGYQLEVSHFAGCTLVIDDNAHLDRYYANFVLNQNLGANAEMYAGKADQSELLLGTQFALIRSEFMRPGSRPKPKTGSVRNVLVTLGGSDPTNATRTVIDGLRAVQQRNLEFRVLIGQLNPHRESLHDQIRDDDRFTLLDHVNDMAAQYHWADFAIAAGGSSNWEMCYFGIPRMVIVIAENQVESASQMHRLGIAENLGSACNVNPDRITKSIKEIVASPEVLGPACVQSMKLVDGLGPRRCIDHLRGEQDRLEVQNPRDTQPRSSLADSLNQEPLILRKATLRDRELLLNWRNDPTTRAASRETTEVSEDTHRAWLQRSLGDNRRTIYIAELNGTPVGTIRVDTSDTPELSWTVAPTSRGQGIGLRMVNQAVTIHGDRTLIAVARSGNFPSRRIAESTGFAMVSDDGNWITFVRQPTQRNAKNE